MMPLKRLSRADLVHHGRSYVPQLLHTVKGPADNTDRSMTILRMMTLDQTSEAGHLANDENMPLLEVSSLLRYSRAVNQV